MDSVEQPPTPVLADVAANTSLSEKLRAPAAGDLQPRSAKERDLCRAASSPDWLYIGLGTGVFVGSIAYDLEQKFAETPFVRSTGAAAVGLGWGFFLGGLFPSLPKCFPQWVNASPPEGGNRSLWPIALSVASVAALTGPMIMGIEQGPTATVPISGTPWREPVGLAERQARVALSASFSFVGALIPYVLPPRTVRASRELERLRVEPQRDGLYVGYTLRF